MRFDIQVAPFVGILDVMRKTEYNRTAVYYLADFEWFARYARLCNKISTAISEQFLKTAIFSIDVLPGIIQIPELEYNKKVILTAIRETFDCGATVKNYGPITKNKASQ